MPPLFQDSTRFRLSIALGTAVALHVATALFGYRLGHEDVAPAIGARSDDAIVELFDPGSEIGGAAALDAEESSAPIAIAPSSIARARERRLEPVAGDSTKSTGAHSLDPGGREDGYALDPSARGATGEAEGQPIQLGINAGDWSRWVDPTAPPVHDPSENPSLRPAPASSTGGLAEALEARDQKLGLGPAGAVLSAVHDASHAEIAPALGAATFSITVLRSGAIDVQLTGASSEAAAWAKVGDQIAAAIRRKPPRISPSRSGVRLGIEVIAEERWPNGQATRTDSAAKLVATPPKFQMTETAKEELRDRNPAAVPDPDAPADKPPLQANVSAPGVFVQGRGKVCSYRVGLSLIPISGGCDPANIGARAQRVVSTRVVSETML